LAQEHQEHHKNKARTPRTQVELGGFGWLFCDGFFFVPNLCLHKTKQANIHKLSIDVNQGGRNT